MAKAQLVWKSRAELSDDAFVEGVVWRVPAPVPGSTHLYKYRLALVVQDVCVLRFDNERGKGDHKHMGEREGPYLFRGYDQLITDFLEEVDRWMRTR